MRISVLVPSRGRPGPLRESIDSLLDHAEKPADIEILAALDPDDWKRYQELFGQQNTVFYIMDAWWGYGQLHEYYNELAGHATGDWLMVWNDDARMLTYGWDVCVHGPHQVLWCETNHCPGAILFPIWPRAWYEVTGHVAPVVNVDSWIGDIAHRTGAWARIPVVIDHLRADITGHHYDQTYTEGRGAQPPGYTNHPSFEDPENVAIRQRDIGLIVAYETERLNHPDS